uniref:Uncharacterized protein n=1 Tax=Candidatus Methanophaga sp. ANME-1 ERB7 TaxID=2759913 RepID=A0A7G9ZBF4_9EURY|nr:hypothetical protein GIFCIIHN_00004 [Methanosarcinales archaeon ANME-1 ERB7]
MPYSTNFSFWLKSEMTEADWESEDLQGQQMELLKCSNVTLLDDKEVNGRRLLCAKNRA